MEGDLKVEAILAAALNGVAYIIIALLGIYGGRKLVGPNQDKLVDTLKDLLEIQTVKITVLEEENTVNKNKITVLEGQITELKALTIFQANEIAKLQSAKMG